MVLPKESGPYKRDIPDEAAPSAAASAPAQTAKTPVTMLIVALNALVFVMMTVFSGGKVDWQPSLAAMLTWGADHGPQTLAAGQYWRLLSSTFLHFDLIHIASNMYALWNVGPVVEILYGRSKFLFIYLVSGVLASLTSLYFHPQSVSAGASGAIFGAFGAFLVILRHHAGSLDPRYVKSATGSIIMLIILNLMVGSSIQRIDNFAHIGGFIFGALAGLACMPAHLRSAVWSSGNRLCAATLLVLCYCSFKMDQAHYGDLSAKAPADSQSTP